AYRVTTLVLLPNRLTIELLQNNHTETKCGVGHICGRYVAMVASSPGPQVSGLRGRRCGRTGLRVVAEVAFLVAHRSGRVFGCVPSRWQPPRLRPARRRPATTGRPQWR